MNKIFLALAVTACLSACTSATSDDPGGNNTFNPPSASFFKVDGVSSLPSADKVNAGAATIRVTKAFEFVAGERRNASLNANIPRNYAYRDSVKEGGIKEVHISSRNVTDSFDSILLYLTMDFYPSGVYELQAQSGRLYYSKLNDTIQLSTNGPVTVTGVNTLPPYDMQTRTVEFHLRNQVSF